MTPVRADIRPELLRWARERAEISVAVLERRFPKLEAWERGNARPTLKQLESFAKATCTPVGFLFLPKPPVEAMPIPDFRTAVNVHTVRPSPDLLDTVYLCQQRQEWYRWLGQSALSDSQAQWIPEHEVERWCSCVAAELLVPLAAVRAEYRPDAELRAEMDRLARRFKVSTLVVLRRIHDAGGLTREELWAAYDRELGRLRALPRGSGGDFYLTQAARVSKRFARALVMTTFEGRNSFTEAFRLLGIRKVATLRRFGTELGLAV